MKLSKIFAILIVALMSCFTLDAFAAAASVFELTGSVSAIPGAGAPRTLRKGDAVEQGETVSTGAMSSVVLKFEDGQVTALSANSRMAITAYTYNKTDANQSNMLLSLLQGGMRAVTGLIGKANPTKVAYRAGNATIGIRGTDINLNNNAGNVSVTVNNGQITFSFTPPGSNTPQTVTINAAQGVTIDPTTMMATVKPASEIIAAIQAKATAPSATQADIDAANSIASTLTNNATATAVQQAVQQANDDSAGSGNGGGATGNGGAPAGGNGGGTGTGGAGGNGGGFGAFTGGSASGGSSAGGGSFGTASP